MKVRPGFWIAIVIVLIAIWIYYPFSPAARLARNRKLGAQHLERLTPLIQANPRFADVELMVLDGGGSGYIAVGGEVATQADSNALDELITKSHPPLHVAFRVNLRDEGLPVTTSRPVRRVGL